MKRYIFMFSGRYLRVISVYITANRSFYMDLHKIVYNLLGGMILNIFFTIFILFFLIFFSIIMNPISIFNAFLIRFFVCKIHIINSSTRGFCTPYYNNVFFSYDMKTFVIRQLHVIYRYYKYLKKINIK